MKTGLSAIALSAALIFGSPAAWAGNTRAFGQFGSFGKASVAAIVDFGSGSVSIDQSSNLNVATVVQIGGTVDATIVQSGSQNFAHVIQVGTDASATIAQFGGTNQAFVRQIGLPLAR